MNSDWVLIGAQADLIDLQEKVVWSDATVVELIAYHPSFGDQPPGASGSGYNFLDLRVLIHLQNNSYLELIFDNCEYTAVNFNHVSISGKIDSLGRFKGSLNRNIDNDIQAGRVRFRYITMERFEPYFYKMQKLD